MNALNSEVRLHRAALFGALIALGCGGTTEGRLGNTDTLPDAGPGAGGVGAGSGGSPSGAGGRATGGVTTGGVTGGSTGGTGTPDAGDVRAGVSSGVPPSELGNQLNASDIQDLCAAELRYLQSRISDQDLTNLGCFFLAAASSGGATPTVSACQASFSDCVANAGAGTSTAKCSVDQSKLAACTATVAELEACMSAAIDQTAATLPKLTCDIFSLSQSEIQARLAAINQIPPACAPVQQKCPGALSNQ